MCEVEQREVVALGDVVQGRHQVPARVQGHPGHVTRGHNTRDTKHVTRDMIHETRGHKTRVT